MHFSVRDQRNPQEGTDALLEEDRVQDSRVVDVVESHRTSLRSDPPRKPLPDRDPDAMLDLLFDPLRRAGNELVLLGIQEQNGRCVRPEDVANPQEQFVE